MKYMYVLKLVGDADHVASMHDSILCVQLVLARPMRKRGTEE